MHRNLEREGKERGKGKRERGKDRQKQKKGERKKANKRSVLFTSKHSRGDNVISILVRKGSS